MVALLKRHDPSAAAYRLKDRLLIHPWGESTVGVGIATEPWIAIPLDSGPDSVGRATREALAHSVTGLPHPIDWRGFAAPRLLAAGVKSERAFQLSAALVSI